MSELYQNFSNALQYLKYGAYMARAGWNDKKMWIKYCQPTGDITHPFLAIEYPKGSTAYPKGSIVPWLASQADILAEDWFVVPAPALYTTETYT